MAMRALVGAGELGLWPVELSGQPEWYLMPEESGGTFLPTTSCPVPPGKPQLTAGAQGNETEETTGPARSSGSGAAGAEGLAFRRLGGCS